MTLTWNRAALCALMLTGNHSALSAQLSKPEIKTLPGGRVQVVNTGPSAWSGTNGWKLELERTITPEDGSPGMLARPERLGVNSTGRIVVADGKINGLLVYGADGQFVRKIGRNGDGPGEFRPPVMFDVRGDTIGVYSPNNAKSLVWRLDGTLIGEWRSSPCCGADITVLDGRGATLVPAFVTVGGAERSAMVRWQFNGTVVDTIVFPPPDPRGPSWRAPNGGAVGIPFRTGRQETFDSRLTYIYGNSSRYTLIVARHGTDTSRVVVLPGVRARVPDSLRDSMYQRYRKSPLIGNIVKLEDIPTEQPYFGVLHADEQDNIWIERPGPDGTTASFDIIDSDGRFLGAATAPRPNTRSAVWRNGRMYCFAENADGAPVIEVYRVNRRGLGGRGGSPR